VCLADLSGKGLAVDDPDFQVWDGSGVSGRTMGAFLNVSDQILDSHFQRSRDVKKIDDGHIPDAPFDP
jgi:hypothetical protein